MQKRRRASASARCGCLGLQRLGARRGDKSSLGGRSVRAGSQRPGGLPLSARGGAEAKQALTGEREQEWMDAWTLAPIGSQRRERGRRHLRKGSRPDVGVLRAV